MGSERHAAATGRQKKDHRKVSEQSLGASTPSMGDEAAELSFPIMGEWSSCVGRDAQERAGRELTVMHNSYPVPID
jgi:hypothetical protein